METTISREEAIALMKPDSNGISLMEKLGIQWIMNKEYGQDDENNYDEQTGHKLWVGVDSSDYESIVEDEVYQSFQIW